MTLTWFQTVRLGLVQIALGSIVSLTTSTMNRVMSVELDFPAVLPGLLVGLYYGTQFLRPRFGHSADQGGRRTPWIVGGVAVLAAGAIGAALAVGLMGTSAAWGLAAAVPSFLLIGLGIGAAGTNLLALLAARVDPAREAAAGSVIWIMMIFGLVVTAIVCGRLLDPYSPGRLVAVTAGVSAVAFTLTLIGIQGQERGALRPPPRRSVSFGAMLAELWTEPRTRAFTIFVFAAMTAYNLQDLILEPFAGHVFGMSVGESTTLSGQHHAGALVGMIAVFLSGTLVRRWVVVPLRVWIVGGCVLSGLALIALACGAQVAPAWPLAANVFALGLANGAFAVAAIGMMMGLARDGTEAREGARMGLFGAAQAIGFGVGSFAGTVAADLMRSLLADDAAAYGSVFAAEGAVFLIAALLAMGIAGPERAHPRPTNLVPGE